jgi:hypothetical protein
MSYAMPVEASSKALYASVLSGFYTDSVFNPVSNTMTNVSTFPIQTSMIPNAISKSNTFNESLTCASQNPSFNCSTANDCPGPQSKCAKCSQNKCV